MRKLLLDVGAGFGIGWFNAIPAFWPTVIIIVLRIIFEWIALKRQREEKKKQD